MESRLPKLRCFTTKTQTDSKPEMKMESKVLKEQNKASSDIKGGTKEVQNVPSTSTTNNIILEANKVTKDSQNVTTRSKHENKPPISRVALARGKTLSTIVRSNVTAVKRPAPSTQVNTEVKRPKIKSPKTTQPVRRGITTTRNVKPTASTTNSINKSADVAPKFAKWDLKGRLTHATNEMGTLREQKKELSTKCTALEKTVHTLEDSQKKLTVQIKELTESSDVLKTENESLKSELTIANNNVKDLSERLQVSTAKLTEVSAKLKESQEENASSKKLLLEQTDEINDLKRNLKIQTNLNTELINTKDELQAIVHNMDKDRRLLHNAIQELKGNIRVFCRVRPRTPKEVGKELCHMNFVDDCTIEVGKSDGSDAMSCSGKARGTKQEFVFDKIFSPKASQEDVFEEISLLVQSALEGYNVCIFAYGQTGSGKTYTMEGEPTVDKEGMIPRTIRHIFKEMRQFELLGWNYKIEASFLEIYNENIVDLLDSQQKSHDIRMKDSKGTDLYVTNLTIQEINNPEELEKCLRVAQRNRAVAATHANERSSRSHSVARIRLIGTHTRREEVSIGNLNLVDLAGSERLHSEEMQKSRTTETKNINKSLANLGNVILALLKKQEHIPYRNSKLTYLLMPSLGGNSKTLMFLNISPLDEHYNETLNSLRFASNVNNCKTGNVKATKVFSQNLS